MEKGCVHYCCVAKGGIVLHSYNNNHSNDSSNECGEALEIEKLATLCLEKVPQHHKWYSQTMNKRSYWYLMEDGFVYFAIAEEYLGNLTLIRFLEHYRDEFKKIAKKKSGSRLSWKGKRQGTMSSSNLSSVNFEQLVPIVRELITSLPNVSNSKNDSGNGNGFTQSSSPCENASSTKAPLLGGKLGKQEKKSKENVIGVRGMELEEHHSGSSDRGEDKEMNVSRRRSISQSVRRKWWHLVQLVIAIDAVVCVTLLIIWLVICKGFQCIS